MADKRPCVLCDNPRVPGAKYCKECKKLVLLELQAAGYLTPRPFLGSPRSSEQKENTYETKHGRDG